MFAIKNLFSHSLVKNLSALVILQIANYLFPLLAFPVLAKFLGVDGFGEFMIILAILTMAMILTDFGFNLSATHTISLERENKAKIAQLLGNIFSIKAILGIIGVIAVFIYIRNEEHLRHLSILSLLLIAATILVQSLQCIWFFQGIEKMKNITYATISSKVIYLLLLCVTLPFYASIEIAILCFCISQCLMIGIYIRAIYKEGYSIAPPKVSMLLKEIKHSFSFFISRVAVSAYSTINTILVGSVSGSAIAGLYSSAEKLYAAGMSVSGMLSQATYPYMAKTNNIRLLIKIVVLTAIPYFLGCLVLSNFSEEIMVLIFGEAFREAAVYFELFLLLMCITFLSMNLGYPGFAAIKKVKFANYTVMIGSVFHILALLTLYWINQISAINVLLLVITTEFMVLLLRVGFLIYFYSRGIKNE